jgi:hypothetical protein
VGSSRPSINTYAENLFRSRFRWRLRPRSVTGDAAYGTIDDVAAMEKADIRAYMVLPKHNQRGPLFGKNEFTYDPEKDLFRISLIDAVRRQQSFPPGWW